VYDFMALTLPVSVKVTECDISTLLLTQLTRIRMTTVQNVAGRPNAPRLRGFLSYAKYAAKIFSQVIKQEAG
jgi:hypothetical protein